MSKFTKAMSDAVAAAKKAGERVCVDCGTVARPKSGMQGSLLVEIFLWCLMILPGLIYSIWRSTTKGDRCPSCGSKNLIETGSPRGRVLLQELGGVAKIVATIMLLAFSADHLFAQDTQVAITVPQGTEIEARLTNQLDSGQLHVGDIVTMDVLEDVRIQNVIAIPHGSLVLGHVTEAKGARKMGRGGKLDIEFEAVTAGDGTKVPVSGERVEKGQGGYGAGSAAGAVAAGLFFPPAAALLLLKHGHSSVIPVGTVMTVHVTADTTVAGIHSQGIRAQVVPVAVVAQKVSTQTMTVISPSGSSQPLSDAALKELPPSSQPESLGEYARRMKAEKASGQPQ